MITRIINAISLHDGGGKTYLYLLHSFLDDNHNLIILDYRFKKSHISFKNAKIIFIKKSLFRNLKILVIRFLIYCKNSNYCKTKNIKFEEFYLNGIPPFVRFKNSEIYIFTQNRLIFENLGPNYYDFNYLKLNLYLFINKNLLFLFLRKSDFIIVQTNSMLKLVSKYIPNKIFLQEEIWGEFNFTVLNFIKNNLINLDNKLKNKIKNISSKNILFFYPALFHQYKNHKRLIEAFDLLHKDSKSSFKLLLTLDKNELKNLNIKNLTNIVFLGKIDYLDVINLYDYIDFLVYPSLYESYGLPLKEASMNNIRIIASELEYVYEVCKPFLTFNPLSVDDIFIKLKTASKQSKNKILDQQ